jgi:hypothetical protein
MKQEPAIAAVTIVGPGSDNPSLRIKYNGGVSPNFSVLSEMKAQTPSDEILSMLSDLMGIAIDFCYLDEDQWETYGLVTGLKFEHTTKDTPRFKVSVKGNFADDSGVKSPSFATDQWISREQVSAEQFSNIAAIRASLIRLVKQGEAEIEAQARENAERTGE